MTQDQALILAALAATMGLFIWGRWRHDMVALASLLACVLAGLIPASKAFAGFGHPAVITVACVLVLSQGLQSTGAVDALARRLLPSSASTTVMLFALTGIGALLSAFINNVGAMALLMPVAIQFAARRGIPPGRMLMPLAFATILGGMTTLIGTPPNLIVAAFRAETGSGSFGMFDFTPVGLSVAVVGVIFVCLLGWRLVPARQQKGAAGFDTGSYLTEVRVIEAGAADGKRLREIEQVLDDADAQVVGMVRNDVHLTAPNPSRILRSGDILVLAAEPDSLVTLLSGLGLELEEAVATEKVRSIRTGSAEVTAATETENDDWVNADTVLQELVALPTSPLVGRSASQINLRSRHGLNLLALSHEGRQSIRRLRSTQIRAGDVLLIQGPADSVADFAAQFGCVPLASRSLRIPDKGKVILASAVMAAAVSGAAFGLLPAAVSFTVGVLAYMVLRIVPPQRIYEAIDWPVIVLLAALIPVAGAMATTGAADLVAGALLDGIARGHPVIALGLILIVTMTLSDFMNNAATAAVMCPIAISTSSQLGANPDAFLMAVAIGASCAFLTPIGHQNNTLILGPGGFRFGDYWRLGLPMEVIVVCISLPLLLMVWPL